MWPFSKLAYKERLGVDELDALDPTDPESAKKLIDAPLQDLIALRGRAIARERQGQASKWEIIAAALEKLDVRLMALEARIDVEDGA